MRVIGTINKRVDIGVDKDGEEFFILSPSNCIRFTNEELDCLLAVFAILTLMALDDAIEYLNLNTIKLWEPKPPEAVVIM